jgi:DNA-binding NtrC family response regulator
MNKAIDRETMPTVLVVDDQADVREALRLLLKAEGVVCVGVAEPAQALELVERQVFDCALIDGNYRRDTTSGEEGLQLLKHLRQQAPELPLIMMTAWGNVTLAVEAMRQGAADFIEKPWNNARLIAVLRGQLALSASLRKQQRLEAENALLRGAQQVGVLSESPSMREVLALAERIAPTEANVLIFGENGTGKGVMAEFLHSHSLRAQQPLVKVNMGGIADSVFESEIFGHVRGAFTDAKNERIGRFELAEGGSLFLDEIGNVPATQQPKLLRVLEDGEFERLGSSRTQRANVRVITATNADLHAEVAAGRFRRDLLYRLNTFELHMPPLRARREDVLPMARNFLTRSARRYGRFDMQLAPSAEDALLAWHWPGNVRELQHVMERAALLSECDQVGAAVLGLGERRETSTLLESMTLEQAEEWLIQRALKRSAGNVQHAAEALGLSRQALYRRLEKRGLQLGASADASN